MIAMNIRSIINRLEANLREEIEAKREALLVIKSQEEAVTKSDADAFDEAHGRSIVLIEAEARRAAKRTNLMGNLAREWQVADDALTLGSVAVRLAADGTRLCELRLELREVVALVIKRNRRLSALIGMHRRLNRDILTVVLGTEEGADPASIGSLVNAQA